MNCTTTTLQVEERQFGSQLNVKRPGTENSNVASKRTRLNGKAGVSEETKQQGLASGQQKGKAKKVKRTSAASQPTPTSLLSSDGESWGSGDTDQSLFSSDSDEWENLISQPSLKELKFPDSYNEVDIKGACPLFRNTVLSSHKKISDDKTDVHFLEEDSEELAKVKSVLNEYAGKTTFSDWTGVHLPAVLNLLTPRPPKKSVQVLFLAVGTPPFVLVLYGSGTTEESARDSASSIARSLTRLLLNYCHCQFILLACALTLDGFSAEKLRSEVERKRRETSKVYYRRQNLSRNEYLQLKEAVTTLSRAVPVDQHTSDAVMDKTLQKLVVLDQAWFSLVLYFIKRMTRAEGKMEKESHHRLQDPNQMEKAKVAAKEAGRRLGREVKTEENQNQLKIRLEIPEQK